MPTIYLNTQQRSLPERILYAILALALVVLGFFFLAAAVVAGAILAGIVLLRLWWLKRKLKKGRGGIRHHRIHRDRARAAARRIHRRRRGKKRSALRLAPAGLRSSAGMSCRWRSNP